MAQTKNRTLRAITALISLFWVFSPYAANAATTLIIEADKPSGTYESPISVTLTASDPKAKIWYVFDPNSGPNDALPYSTPVRIEKSTPFLFFAYTDLKNESKIERRDYVIKLPTTLRFSEGTVEIAAGATNIAPEIFNFGSIEVSLAGWAVLTDKGRTLLPAGTTVPAGGKYRLPSLPYGEGGINLMSGDGEVRSVLSVTRKPAEKPVVVAPVKPAAASAPAATSAPVGPVSEPVAVETPATTETTAPLPEAPAVVEGAPSAPEASIPNTEPSNIPAATPIETPEPTITPPSETESASIKISAVETTDSKGGKTAIFFAI
jgi:hypothetical protein